jgi:hypothetical protein
MSLVDYLYADDEIDKIFGRLKKTNHAKVNSSVTQRLSRNDVVKGWRDNDYIYFSKDRRKNVSWINIEEINTLKNKGKKWFF